VGDLKNDTPSISFFVPKRSSGWWLFGEASQDLVLKVDFLKNMNRDGDKGAADKSSNVQDPSDGKDKPPPSACCGRLQCLFRCGTGCIKYCFFCCLPCIDYCCFDTTKCLEAMETCTFSCAAKTCLATCCGPFLECASLVVCEGFELPCAGGEDLEDWGDGGSYDVRMIFWDLDGNLRLGSSLRSRDDELLSLLKTDFSNMENPDTIWMIIPSRWARKWVLFSHLRLTDEEPGRIDMYSLMMPDKNEVLGWRPKVNLKPPIAESEDPTIQNAPGHYRRIPLAAYKELERLYGVDGYPMAVWGDPYDDFLRWRIFESSDDVRRFARDECPIPKVVEEQRAAEAKAEEAAAKRREKNDALNEDIRNKTSSGLPNKSLLGGLSGLGLF